jgi:hypothetical protein
MELTVTWLSVYVYRGVPLLSLSMHLILAIFSESRRREDRSWKRLLVWVAYQLTDWGPAYVISNLYLETKPPEKMIIAFWVPFLLLHHARPDNISAYTIEDSVLWIRLIVSVLPKSGGSIIIVYRFILTDCAADWSLRWASGIMLFLGILKYLESAAALWLCNLGHIREWLPKKHINLSNQKDDEGTVIETDDEALLVAHKLFEICKGAFCDYTVDTDRKVVRDVFSGKWESMCTVVEMELSLMYDFLYTKAAVVYTWWGYAIRLASPPLTATALLLFGLHCKDGMKGVYKVISYILLFTTFLLDVRWLFRALASAWTQSFLKAMPHNWLKHAFLCRERWKKLRVFVMSLCLSRLSLCLWTCAYRKEPKSYRRWSGTFGQHNLLDQCTGGQHVFHNIFRWGRKSEWEDHSSGLEIPDYVKKLVFNNICVKLFTGPARPTKPGQQGHNIMDLPPSPPSQGKPPIVLTNGPAVVTDTVMDQPLGTPDSREQVCHGMDNKPCLWPPCSREQICNCVDNEPPPWPPCPGSRICNGVDNETSPWPPCPTEQMCHGLDSESPPWSPYPGPGERICIGINNELPMWSPYPGDQICIGINNEPPMSPPCPRQVCACMRNVPFDQSK